MYSTITDLLIKNGIKYAMFSVGCAMGRYELNTITPNNNQQNPLFFEKLKHHKVNILIDPVLEKIPQAVKLLGENQYKPNFPLNQYKNVEFFVPSNKDLPFFICVREEIDYECNNFLKELYTIIERVLENNIFLIWQDYTGKILDHLALDVLKKFSNKQHEVLQKVIFDVSQKDSGCFVDFSSVELDFRQPRFLKLSDSVYNSMTIHFQEALTQRIYYLRHPLLWKYKNNLELTDEEKEHYQYKNLSLIYQQTSTQNLVESVLRDICKCREIVFETSLFAIYLKDIETSHPQLCEILRFLI